MELQSLLPRNRHAGFRPLRSLTAYGPRLGKGSCFPVPVSPFWLLYLSISVRITMSSDLVISQGSTNQIGLPERVPVAYSGIVVVGIQSVTRESEPGVLWAFDRPTTRLNRANRRRSNHPSSLSIFDGHTRATSASPGRLDNFWKVCRCEALGFLLAEQDNRACGAASATLRELTCPKVTPILPAWSVIQVCSLDGSTLTSFQFCRATMT